MPMQSLQLNPPLRVFVSRDSLGEGEAVVLSDYGQDEAYLLVILDTGPLVWVKTSECRRARNWTGGWDPDGKAAMMLRSAIENSKAADQLEKSLWAPPIAQAPLANPYDEACGNCGHRKGNHASTIGGCHYHSCSCQEFTPTGRASHDAAPTYSPDEACLTCGHRMRSHDGSTLHCGYSGCTCKSFEPAGRLVGS